VTGRDLDERSAVRLLEFRGELRFRLVACAEAHAEAFRAMRRARGFVCDTTREAFVLNGRTTLLASAATAPKVEPIFSATLVNSVDFVGIRLAP
jgi:hypothetical protein